MAYPSKSHPEEQQRLEEESVHDPSQKPRKTVYSDDFNFYRTTVSL